MQWFWKKCYKTWQILSDCQHVQFPVNVVKLQPWGQPIVRLYSCPKLPRGTGKYLMTKEVSLPQPIQSSIQLSSGMLPIIHSHFYSQSSSPIPTRATSNLLHAPSSSLPSFLFFFRKKNIEFIIKYSYKFLP